MTMQSEHDPCRWWTDPADGRRYFIPGCMGAAVGGKRSCTCPALPKRRAVLRHHPDPLDDYANAVRQWATAREENAVQRKEIRELKARIRELEAMVEDLADG